jgi:hypothetical protein
MRRVDGSKMSAGALKGFCEGRIRQLDKLISDLSAFTQLPDAFKPKARMYEAQWAKDAFLTLIKGNEKKAVEMFACVPSAIGKVNLFVSDFVVHMGWGWMEEEYEGPDGPIIIPVAGIRNRYVDDPWAWVEIKEAMKSLDIPKDVRPITWLMEHEYKVQKQNMGMSRCLGWNELVVTFTNSEDQRTFNRMKITRKHECKSVYLASEPFHRPRCQSCDNALKDFRNVGGKKSVSKADSDKDLNRLLATLNK